MSQFYEMVKDRPAFKRYCARQSTRPIAKPKRFKVPIPKPKGMLSVLGEYTTGRMIRVAHIGHEYDPAQPDSKGAAKEPTYSTIDERAILQKINGEFISKLHHESDLPIETVSQKPCDNWEFGKDAPDKFEPLEDADADKPQEPTDNEPQQPVQDDSATLRLLAALEQQNALLRQLAARV